MNDIETLKRTILDKKELRNLDNEFIESILNEVIQKNKAVYENLKEKNYNARSKEFEIIKKEVRKKLRKVYGVFSTNKSSSNKLHKLLEDFRLALKQKQTKEKDKIIKQILDNHLSTKERLPYYPQFYKKIIAPLNPKNVLDLGCGLNPLSLEFTELRPKYVASDIADPDLNIIETYFKIKKIDGETLKADLTKNLEKITKKSEEADITLLLKLADTLEAIKKDSAKKLIESLQSKTIIISVPLGSISGKNKIKSERNWLKKIIENKEKEGWKRQEIILGNERYISLNK
jgi:hypothetical protein